MGNVDINDLELKAVFGTVYGEHYLKMLTGRDPNLVEYMYNAFCHGWEQRELKNKQSIIHPTVVDSDDHPL